MKVKISDIPAVYFEGEKAQEAAATYDWRVDRLYDFPGLSADYVDDMLRIMEAVAEKYGVEILYK